MSDYPMDVDQPAVTTRELSPTDGKPEPPAAADMADNLALLRDCRGALETLRALDKAGVLASLARQHGL